MTDNRNILLGLGLLAAAPWLIGAATGDSVGDGSTVITISGRAEVPRQPPFVTLAAAVESDASTASGAMRDNAQTLARLRAVLARSGIRPQDVRTVDLSLQPRRDSNESSRIIGFKVTHQLSITFRNIDQSGSVIDALVDAGANNIQGPRMTSWRPERVEPASRHAAIVDANAQAQAYARSLGLRVRRVIRMSDGGSHASPAPMAAIAARADSTQIMPGEEVVQTVINAEYELVR